MADLTAQLYSVVSVSILASESESVMGQTLATVVVVELVTQAQHRAPQQRHACIVVWLLAHKCLPLSSAPQPATMSRSGASIRHARSLGIIIARRAATPRTAEASRWKEGNAPCILVRRS